MIELRQVLIDSWYLLVVGIVCYMWLTRYTGTGGALVVIVSAHLSYATAVDLLLSKTVIGLQS